MKSFIKIGMALMVPIAFAVGWETGVCTSNALHLFPGLVEAQDSEGGAIVYWVDNRANRYEIFAKRIKGSDGSTYGSWSSQGKEVSRPYVSSPQGHRLSPVATYSNQEGQIILAWINWHNLDPYKQGIYVTKLSANNGSLLWNDYDSTRGGKFISSSTNPPAIAPCQGGCIISWLDTSGDTTIIDTIVKNGDTVIDTTTRTLYRIMVEKRYSDGNRAWTDTLRSDITGAKGPKAVPNILSNGNQDGVWVESISKTILTKENNSLDFLRRKYEG